MSFLMSCGAICMVLSFWGIIQLWGSRSLPDFITSRSKWKRFLAVVVLMGIFFKTETLALLHSVEAEEFEDVDDFIKLTKKNYSIVATNCFIAAAMYAVMIGISCLCMRVARKAEMKRAEMLEDDDLSCKPPNKSGKSKQKQK